MSTSSFVSNIPNLWNDNGSDSNLPVDAFGDPLGSRLEADLNQVAPPFEAYLGNHFAPPVSPDGHRTPDQMDALGFQASDGRTTSGPFPAPARTTESATQSSGSQESSASPYVALTQTLSDGSTLVGASSGLQFDLVWDSSVAKAPAGFKSAAIAAASYYSNMFSNPVTIEIDVGWGEVSGSPILAGNVSESMQSLDYFQYSDILPALQEDASGYAAQANSTLPASDPFGATFYCVPTGEAAALGLDTGGFVGGYPDGYVGLSSRLSYDFDTSTTPIKAGQFDAVGAFENEFSEVMGRVNSLGYNLGGGIYTPFDLFRYVGSGVRATSVDQANQYFSMDGGQTNLGVYAPFDVDSAVWNKGVRGDAYGYFSAGRSETVSPTDLVEMNVLGFNLSAAGIAATKTLGLA
jgi:hypothetical protein